MEFVADENVKLRAVTWLRAGGHDVTLAPKGSPDRAVAELAKAEGRILLTHDRDFADSQKFPPSQFAGIVWFNLASPTLERVVTSLAYLLSRLPPSAFAGALITILDVDKFDRALPP